MTRDYEAITGVDSIHMMDTLIMRAAVVTATLAFAFVVGRSMFNDLREEFRAGLT